MAEHIIGDVITAAGRTVKFGAALERDCPTCNRDKMHIRVVIDNTATIECPSCGYYENVPKDEVIEMKDVKGRPIKPPKR